MIAWSFPWRSRREVAAVLLEADGPVDHDIDAQVVPIGAGAGRVSKRRWPVNADIDQAQLDIDRGQHVRLGHHGSQSLDQMISDLHSRVGHHPRRIGIGVVAVNERHHRDADPFVQALRNGPTELLDLFSGVLRSF